MAVVLVWNVNKKPSVDGLVQSLVRQFQVDVVLLVEYPSRSSQLPEVLQKDGLFRQPSPEAFGVFVRSTHTLARLRYRVGKRVGMWRWTPPSGQEGLIVLLHGLDRRNHDDSTRRVFFRRVADAVRRDEDKRGHRRTIVTGD